MKLFSFSIATFLICLSSSCAPGDIFGREKVVASCTVDNQSDFVAVAYLSVDSSSAADNCDPDTSGITRRLEVNPGETASDLISMRCSVEPDARINVSLIDAPADTPDFLKRKDSGSVSTSLVCKNDGCTEF